MNMAQLTQEQRDAIVAQNPELASMLDTIVAPPAPPSPYTAEQLAHFNQLELQHRQLAAGNPIVAAAFRERHSRAIEVATTQPERLIPNVDAPRTKSIESILGIDRAWKYR
jgi:hypothetical protein